jgi:hypothetical protein
MSSSIWFWSFLILVADCSIHGQVNIHGTTANGWDFVRDLFKENIVKERDLVDRLRFIIKEN